MTAPDGGWSRLHPLTPLLRGGRFAVLLLALVGQQGLRESPPAAVAALLGVGVPVGLLLGWLSWRATRFRIDAEDLQVESGVLTKRSRRVPLARLQSVDVVRPFYARVLGLSELRLEVVGGGEAEAPLAFLSEDRAERVRRTLLDLSAGRREPDAVEAPEQVLVSVPTGALVGSVLLGLPAAVLLLFLVLVPVSLLVDARVTGGLVAATIPGLLGTGSFVVRRLLGEYGFTVAEAPDGLRLRRGLLDTRSSTIPAGRVQAVRVLEPLLWRRQGWVRVEVDVAGYAARGGEQQAVSGVLLPVAPRALADALVARVLGGPLPVADRPVPDRARWRAPLQRRRLRVGLDQRHLVTTSGVLTTTTDVAPLARVQSLRLTSGPWQRRLGLASVVVDTAGRRLPSALAPHRDAQEARRLLEELTTAARAARTAG